MFLETKIAGKNDEKKIKSRTFFNVTSSINDERLGRKKRLAVKQGVGKRDGRHRDDVRQATILTRVFFHHRQTLAFSDALPLKKVRQPKSLGVPRQYIYKQSFIKEFYIFFYLFTPQNHIF